MYGNTQKGTYDVKNKEKYLGTRNPRYLSSYELEFFKWADRTSSVIRWGAEIVVVPYFDPIKNKKRRYIVDIYMEVKTRDGSTAKHLVEIKPHQFTKKPSSSSKRKKTTILAEQATFVTNSAKWEAADKYAAQRGWSFSLITERDIFKG